MIKRSFRLLNSLNKSTGVSNTSTTSKTIINPNTILYNNNNNNTEMENQNDNKKCLTLETICPNVISAQYAVRGELVIRAEAIGQQLVKQKKEGIKLLPFDDIVYCNIGNPQQLKQKPLSFFRQVVSLVENPDLLNNSLISQIYPSDVINRAKELLTSISGTTGAYSSSQGVPLILQSVADFIQRRDGHPSDPHDIFLTDGASTAVQRILKLLINGRTDGIMIPIPQYPLYSATIELYNGTQLGYYLNEENGWSLEVSELERSYQDAVSRGIKPRALVIINPGNPTGQSLDYENMKGIIEFCYRNKLVLLADEVYQENVYVKEQKPFVSFKKVAKDMGGFYSSMEMVSFHSVSKGFVGECGKRGGYMELNGFLPEIRSEIYKLASIGLCPNVIGQLVVDLMVRPPVQGEPSYDLYIQERDSIYNSLKRRAFALNKALNSLEGVTCNPSEGAMYAFPQIRLPTKAVEHAKSIKKSPDTFYCISLLEETGIVTVPGSGFGQRDGTYHFRTTFLPSEEAIEGVCKKMSDFHAKFMNKYR
ncbi:alanine transaminase [Tieghemostelium lacteum]|uniref:Alanine transaminase n=1 Tax=Tieghemostelium lacteum TaxID=361077 RepID=A0A151ZH01_TIELA|nr:alanine transaminase [Tieghemostelium lacteum]|eukprot:KYQ93252.1 alanine transaminase [Tieghemostelium lacteum]